MVDGADDADDADQEGADGQGADEEAMAQSNVGRENMAGSGEWPSPDTPPTGPAPGPSEVPDRSRGPTQFKDALERDPVLGGSSTAGDPG